LANGEHENVAGNGALVIGERPFLGHINVRGSSSDPRFVAAMREALGVPPPDAPNTTAEAGGIVVYWLGPAEWLTMTPFERKAEVESRLRAALLEVRSAVTDVSGGQTVIAIHGRAAREVLAKGCPLDLHPRSFGIGQCAQSRLAKAGVLLRIVDRAPTFEIVVRRSYAEYLWLWLSDAAAEYRIPSTK
jgi:sarcosine oxidase subunit gamma